MSDTEDRPQDKPADSSDSGNGEAARPRRRRARKPRRAQLREKQEGSDGAASRGSSESEDRSSSGERDAGSDREGGARKRRRRRGGRGRGRSADDAGREEGTGRRRGRTGGDSADRDPGGRDPGGRDSGGRDAAGGDAAGAAPAAGDGAAKPSRRRKTRRARNREAEALEGASDKKRGDREKRDGKKRDGKKKDDEGGRSKGRRSRRSKDRGGERSEGGGRGRKKSGGRGRRDGRDSRGRRERGRSDRGRSSRDPWATEIVPQAEPPSDPPRKKILLVNADDKEEARIALLVDGRLEEVYIEPIKERSLAGNIYRGRVQNVEKGIGACFVDLGRGQTGFLHASDLPLAEGEDPRQDITDRIHPGDEVLVQITRDGIGRKGPALTGRISLPGRYLVLMPFSSRSGISRRIPQGPDRDRMRKLLKRLEVPEGMGVIVRTAGESTDLAALEADLFHLHSEWVRVKQRLAEQEPPGVLRGESDIAERSVRDIMPPDVTRIVVDRQQIAGRIHQLLRTWYPSAAAAAEVAGSLAVRQATAEASMPRGELDALREERRGSSADEEDLPPVSDAGSTEAQDDVADLAPAASDDEEAKPRKRRRLRRLRRPQDDASPEGAAAEDGVAEGRVVEGSVVEGSAAADDAHAASAATEEEAPARKRAPRKRRTRRRTASEPEDVPESEAVPVEEQVEPEDQGTSDMHDETEADTQPDTHAESEDDPHEETEDGFAAGLAADADWAWATEDLPGSASDDEDADVEEDDLEGDDLEGDDLEDDDLEDDDLEDGDIDEDLDDDDDDDDDDDEFEEDDDDDDAEDDSDDDESEDDDSEDDEGEVDEAAIALTDDDDDDVEPVEPSEDEEDEESQAFVDEVAELERQSRLARVIPEVLLHTDDMPLFHAYDVETQLEDAFRRSTRLPSGGSIVIDQTEALVAVDVNSGRLTDEADPETTALVTNLEALEEGTRQLRLRDLGGLVVWDFIDMRERKSRKKVEKALHQALSRDRARIRVGRMGPFGCVIMSRQRIRQALSRVTHDECPHCAGTGRRRHDTGLGLRIVREMRARIARSRGRGGLEVRAPQAVVEWLKRHRSNLLRQLRGKCSGPIVLKADSRLATDGWAMKGLPPSSEVGDER